MKDLIQEGRKIQETFTQSLNEMELDKDYVSDVQDVYVKMAQKIGSLGKFKFRNNVQVPDGSVGARNKVNLGGWNTNNGWFATTQSGKDIMVLFEPFLKRRSQFEITTRLEYYKSLNVLEQNFKKRVTSTGDVQKDAKMAMDYIKNVLMSPDIKKILEE
jgi:hypothetical protein